MPCRLRSARLALVVLTLATLVAWTLVAVVVVRLAGPFRRRFGDLPGGSQHRFAAAFVLGALVSGMCLRSLVSASTHSWIGGTLMAVFVAGLWASMALEVKRIARERRG